MQRGRISGLDQARSIAIIAVVAVHLSFQFPHLPQWATVLARMGQYGVQLFFVISAVTIFMTLDADRERYRAATHVTARFYIKRFFRIAPLYYVAIAAYGAMSWYTYNFQADHASILGPHDLSDVVLNLLFVHAVSSSAINNVVPGGWSIGVEMLFYSIAPMIFFYATSRARLLVLTAVLLLACAAFVAAGACGGALECNVKNNSFFYFWPPVQVPCFLVGIWCWALFRPYLTGRSKLGRTAAGITLGVVALCGLITAALGVWKGLANEYAPVVAACGSSALVLLCCSAASQRVIGRIAGAIGRESYAIYLWHFVFAFEALYLFKDSHLLATHGPLLSLVTFAAVLAITLAASYVLSRLTDILVQQYASRFARALLERVDMTFAFRRAFRRIDEVGN
jgi:peptidoglycan/LPS O-acetylase OafA/YrhL